MSDNLSDQDQRTFELEQVGLLWQRIHDAQYRLHEIKECSDDDEHHIVFKFKKVK